MDPRGEWEGQPHSHPQRAKTSTFFIVAIFFIAVSVPLCFVGHATLIIIS